MPKKFHYFDCPLSLGAPHDDDPSANCPGPYGYIMSGANEDNRYFFQRCSDVAISSYIK